MTVSFDVVVHVADPLSVIVDENVAVTLRVNEVLGHTALVIHDLPDLSVRDVASSIGATALYGVRLHARTSVETLGAITASLGHVEGSTVAGDTYDDLVRGNLGLGDHDQ